MLRGDVRVLERARSLLRLGQHLDGRGPRLRLRRAGYLPADLVHTAREIEKTGWEEAFVFFKHEDEGAGPMLAAQFLQVASPELADRKAVSVRPRRAARKTG